MEYKFRDIEKKWQQHWKNTNAYKVSNVSDKPKYYVLDMFPYPSGAGLHVGHPLGYIASDIYSRYKKLKGFNVLHPMGFDSFGLPAEQYALETGQHPAETTKKNIANFKAQLDKIGFCYDWEREVQTSDPNYYKWTQWIFLKLFNSYFDTKDQKAKPIEELISEFKKYGTANYQLPTINFSADEWNNFDVVKQQSILMDCRIAFSAYGEVNWCEALGTVLANDEVVNGVSERGGHPVEKRKMRQWYLRITAYADRLLQGLETVDFSDSMKEMQKNWIGKSSGAEITFPLAPASPLKGEEPDPAKVKMPGFGYAEYSVNSAMSFENAKEMRKNPTEAESVLWEALRNRNIRYKFRRQHPIENYIADFVCLDTWVIVEVDGGYHQKPEQINADKERDAELKLLGFTTLRFKNEEVISEKEIVLQKIKAVCDEIKITADEKRNTVESSSPFEGEVGVRVYTTRPDTIFGVDFMVLAPEHELVAQITTAEQKDAIEKYLHYVKSRSDRERQAEVKQITGCFTGAYAINPFDGKEIPIWIAEYVLAGYGTGAIMAVPCGDQRDFAFAKHFNISITNIIGEHFNGEEANATKEAILQNSGFLNGLLMKDAIEVAIKKIEEAGIGTRKVNYKMRDAGFSRQRYWGEPFPIIWSDGIAVPLDAEELPLELPHVDKYGPGPSGEGPLANLTDWVNVLNGKRETSTMPGYAGSSWYFLRYMDPHNENEFCNRTVSDYWNQVDLYIGGTEHAVGHLLYSRMWTKVLYDLGMIGFDEPFKKLLNQGMIQGSSRFVFEVHINGAVRSFKGRIFASKSDYEKLKNLETNPHEFIQYVEEKINSKFIIKENLEVSVTRKHVDIKYVDGFQLLINEFNSFLYPEKELGQANFILEDDSTYLCDSEVEKMSKSKYNTVNPDELCEKYGADTFRMYEMFLGPVEISKPWDTKGIEGVHRFLKKLWRMFFDDVKGKVWNEDKANDAELKVLHKTIKKIEEDTERFSFNTAVSTFMIAVNELSDLKCHKKEILEPLVIMLAPYAPHIAAELYAELRKAPSPRPNDLAGQSLERAGGEATFPKFESKYVTESTKDYPVAINGKTRTELTLDLNITQQEVEQIILNNEVVLKWLDGKQPKKIIYVRNKMINVVV